jgi:hypothetical protein
LFNRFTVKALFAISETEGVIAYAAMDTLELGMIQISKSGLETKDDPLNYFPKKSLLWLLMDKDAKGSVFFLKAGKNECTFYVDGSITLFHLFSFQARMIYSNGLIRISTAFQLAELINVTFALQASYADFSNMNASVVLGIDCPGLEKLLKSTQAKIDDAITALRSKMNKEEDQINQAKTNVSQLYSKIDNLNAKIDDCKSAIRNVHLYKKAFVAMVKGAEICGYEVAKAGVYAVINVANAALELAKHTVSLANVVGEDVRKAVNAAISSAMKLFFVEYIRLSTALSATDQKLEANIKFVALGRHYDKTMKIDGAEFFHNPAGTLDGEISSDVSYDLNHIENGSFKSNRRRYKKTKYTLLENKKQLSYGMKHILEMQRLYTDVGDIYMSNCSEVFPEYIEAGVTFHQSLGEIEAAMELAHTTINFAELDQAVEVMESKMNDGAPSIDDEKKAVTMEAILQYKEASEVASVMSQNAEMIKQSRRDVKTNIMKTRAQERENRNDTKPIDIPPEKLESLLNQTEECLYHHFPPTSDSHSYINLGREAVIADSFSKIRQQEGLNESEAVTKVKGRKVLSKYDSHL